MIQRLSDYKKTLNNAVKTNVYIDKHEIGDIQIIEATTNIGSVDFMVFLKEHDTGLIASTLDDAILSGLIAKYDGRSPAVGSCIKRLINMS